MELSPEQKDAIQEIINIAFHRAAYSLSELTQKRIELKAPEVYIFSIQELSKFLASLFGKDLVMVNQFFKGGISGNAALIMNVDSAMTLVDLVTGERSGLPRLDEGDREALLEIGNILINAYIGTIGNILKENIVFFVPNIRVESVGAMMKSIVLEGEHLQHAIAVVTDFVVKNANVTGCVALILGLTSLEKLLEVLSSYFGGVQK
ncbi:MAG: chemotaxis protein CheC [Thermodesulforhabdaceae bacterium]